jgi:hypothetical protein
LFAGGGEREDALWLYGSRLYGRKLYGRRLYGRRLYGSIRRLHRILRLY